MSLTRSQKGRTASELHANLSLSGLTPAEVSAATGWSSQRLEATMSVRDADPADVWRLRDLLERAVLDAGRSPIPFSVLTEDARAAAAAWFGL